MKIFAFLILGWSMSVSFAQEIDQMAAAELLISNGSYDLAFHSLQKVDVESPEVDKAQYHSLWGLVFLQKRSFDKAKDHFQLALKLGSENKEIYLYLAEVEFHRGKFIEALSLLNKTDGFVKKKTGFFVVLSSVHNALGNKSKAWDTLLEGEKETPGKVIFIKKKFSFLIENNLYFVAAQLVKEAISEKLPQQDLLSMCAHLRDKGQIDFAIQLLEQINFKWPNNEEIVLELANSYVQKKMYYAATLILEKALPTLPNLAEKTAELLRYTGKTYRAERIMPLILNPQKQLRQKLAIFLASEHFHKITHLDAQLNQQGLLQDDEIRYALAFSYYQQGVFDKAEWHLNKISREDLFQKAVEIKKNIATCQKSRLFCYEAI